MGLHAWVHGLYFFATVFGVGVTAVDMLGILGSSEHLSGDHGSHAHGGHDGADHGAHVPLLSILRYVRMGVYFSLGFGPLGLIAEATGAGVPGSFAWAVPGGLAAAFLARAFFRFQQHDVDSSVHDEELLFERGRVIAPLSSTQMGKVRIKLAQAVVERYALAEDAGQVLQMDDVVEIVRVEEDCVYVRRSPGRLSREV